MSGNDDVLAPRESRSTPQTDPLLPNEGSRDSTKDINPLGAALQSKPVQIDSSPRYSYSSEQTYRSGRGTPLLDVTIPLNKSVSTKENDEKNNELNKSSSRRTIFGSEGKDNKDNASSYGYSNDRRWSSPGNNPYNTSNPPPPPPPHYDRGSDSEDDSEETVFFDKAIRRAFIRKVYSLIMCMMVIATGIISFMMLYQPVRKYVVRHIWVVIVAWVTYPVLMIVLICCEKVRRTVPWNYIVLFLITLSLSFMAGCSAARYNTFEVLAAFGITAVLCLGLTVFAFQTKCDFTVISGGLVIASLVMLILGVVLIFWRNKIAMIGYACLGALLGCLFFIFDTQMMMGGNHRYAISPEEYVFAAITIFSDMINIFIMITNIIGLSRS